MDDEFRGEDSQGLRSRPADARATYRLDRQTLGRDWPVWVILGLDAAFGLWAWSRLPARVPVHWGIESGPDRWGPAWEAAFGPSLAAIAVYLILLLTPLLDPRRRNYALFPETLRMFRLAVPLLLVAIHIAMVFAGLGKPVDVGLVARITVPLLFIVMGNSFPRLRFNYMMGIRAPWTLDSEAVWYATHRMAGTLWVAGGIAMLCTALWPPKPGAWAMMGVIAVLVIWPLVYSYRLHRRLFGSSGNPGS